MKKLTLSILIGLFCIISFGTTYYVASDSSGDYQTLTALQADITGGTITNGDIILFRRGDEFYGTLLFNSKNNITLGAYGTGANPIIHGWETVSSWTDEGSGIYSATTTADGYHTMVSFNGVNREMGRTDYYYGWDGHTDSTIYSIDVPGIPDYTGYELVSNNADWTTERHIVSRMEGDTIAIEGTWYYSPTSSSYSSDNWYFFQNSIYFLDSLGDWYVDNVSNKIYVYFGSETPSNYEVKVAIEPTAITYQYGDYLNISDIDIQGYYSTAFKVSAGSDYININSCNFSFCYTGFRSLGTDHDTVINCTFADISNYALDFEWDCDYNYISNNTFKRVGMNVGLNNYFGSYLGVTGGISVFTYGNSSYGHNTICHNNFKKNGYVAISFRGNYHLVEYNYIDSVVVNLRDGGGIYTTGAALIGNAYHNNIIRNNIIDHSFNRGIYLDERAQDIDVYGNSIFNSKLGLQLHKDSYDTIYDNTFHTYKYGLLLQNISNDAVNKVDSNTFVRNIVISTNDNPLSYWLSSASDISTFGTLDTNTYIREGDVTTLFWTYYNSSGDEKTLAEWQALGYDGQSTLTKVDSVEYHYNPTLADSTIIFTGETKTDVEGNEYTDEITLSAFESVVFKHVDLTPTPDQLIVNYKFEDNAADSSGNGYNGTWSGTESYTGGVVGRAATFTSSFIDAGAIPELQELGGGDFTISFWSYNDGISGYLLKCYETGAGWNMHLNGNNGVTFFTYYSGGSNNIGLYNMTDWSYVTVTKSNDIIRVYKNGAYYNMTTITDYDTTSSNFILGQSVTAGWTIDELEIRNYTLTPTQINSEYNADLANWASYSPNMPNDTVSTESFQLNASFDYAYDSVKWSSLSGTFDYDNILSPTFTPIGSGYAYLTVYFLDQTITDSVLVDTNTQTPYQLIFNYKFEDNAADSSGNGFNGTWTGTESYTGGVVGRAATFTSSYINAGAIPELQELGGGNFTISFWSYNQGINGYGISENSSDAGWRTHYNGDNGITFVTYYSGGSNSIGLYNMTDWSYVTATKSNDTIRVYKNGAYYNMTTITDYDTSSGDFRIGYAISTDYVIDELEIYNYAFTGSQITSAYNEDMATWSDYSIGMPNDSTTKDPLVLNATFDYAYDSVKWSSSTGTFDYDNILTPTYTPTGTGYAYLSVYLFNQTITDSVLVDATQLKSALLNTKNLLSEEISDIEISPNPVDQLLNIDFKCENKLSCQVKILNSIGQPIKVEKGTTENMSHFQIHTNNIPQGIYFVNIQIGENIISKKIIVKH